MGIFQPVMFVFRSVSPNCQDFSLKWKLSMISRNYTPWKFPRWHYPKWGFVLKKKNVAFFCVYLQSIYVEFQGAGFLSMFGIHAFNLSKPVYPRSPTWSQPTDPVHIFQLQEPSSPAEACGKGHHANRSKHADGLYWHEVISFQQEL